MEDGNPEHFLPIDFHWNSPAELGVWKLAIMGDKVVQVEGYRWECKPSDVLQGDYVMKAGQIRIVKNSIPKPVA